MKKKITIKNKTNNNLQGQRMNKNFTGTRKEKS